jgi:ABC-type Fe3+-hydroxamate transport system substrate-binding protein
MQYKDQLNRTLEFETTPQRIVCLVPSLTELIIDLGLESQVVGVTKFCIHPSYLRKSKTVVGGTKQVHFDKIRALNPDVILCNKEENTKAMFAELETIAPVHMSHICNFEDALEIIALYGALFAVEKKASSLIEGIQNKYVAFCQFIADEPQLKVAYFIWKNPWMVAANTTFINAMLVLNKFENSFAHLNRYPEIELEAINDNTDIIMLSSEPYPFKEQHISALEQRYPSSKVILVNGEYFSWYGSRLDKAFDYFKTLRQGL